MASKNEIANMSGMKRQFAIMKEAGKEFAQSMKVGKEVSGALLKTAMKYKDLQNYTQMEDYKKLRTQVKGELIQAGNDVEKYEKVIVRYMTTSKMSAEELRDIFYDIEDSVNNATNSARDLGDTISDVTDVKKKTTRMGQNFEEAGRDAGKAFEDALGNVGELEDFFSFKFTDIVQGIQLGSIAKNLATDVADKASKSTESIISDTNNLLQATGYTKETIQAFRKDIMGEITNADNLLGDYVLNKAEEYQTLSNLMINNSIPKENMEDLTKAIIGAEHTMEGIDLNKYSKMMYDLNKNYGYNSEQLVELTNAIKQSKGANISYEELQDTLDNIGDIAKYYGGEDVNKTTQIYESLTKAASVMKSVDLDANGGSGLNTLAREAILEGNYESRARLSSNLARAGLSYQGLRESLESGTYEEFTKQYIEGMGKYLDNLIEKGNDSTAINIAKEIGAIDSSGNITDVQAWIKKSTDMDAKYNDLMEQIAGNTSITATGNDLYQGWFGDDGSITNKLSNIGTYFTDFQENIPFSIGDAFKTVLSGIGLTKLIPHLSSVGTFIKAKLGITSASAATAATEATTAATAAEATTLTATQMAAVNLGVAGTVVGSAVVAVDSVGDLHDAVTSMKEDGAGNPVTQQKAMRAAVKSGVAGTGILGGMAAGAAIGSVVPGLGTVIGGIIGGAIGIGTALFAGDQIADSISGVSDEDIEAYYESKGRSHADGALSLPDDGLIYAHKGEAVIPADYSLTKISELGGESSEYTIDDVVGVISEFLKFMKDWRVAEDDQYAKQSIIDTANTQQTVKEGRFSLLRMIMGGV